MPSLSDWDPITPLSWPSARIHLGLCIPMIATLSFVPQSVAGLVHNNDKPVYRDEVQSLASCWADNSADE